MIELAEITAYDPALGATRVLRYATKGYNTSPSAAPANTPYDDRITNAIDISRTMFSGKTTQGRATKGIGDLVLSNPDGALDDLNELAFDTQPVTILRSDKQSPAYPADFATVFVGTIEQPVFSLTAVTFKLRDRIFEVTSAPLQTTKYLGTNVLPAGLEGVPEDLGGKPKPVCFGVVKNIPAPCVNTSKLIYQVNDGAVESVGDVRDRGVALVQGYGPFTTVASGEITRIRGLAYGAGLFVAVFEGGIIRTSPDATTWTARTSGFGTDDIRAVAYDAVLGFVAAGASGKVSTSPDGITWTARTTGFSDFLRACTTHQGLFVVAGESGRLATSPDGVTWTTQTTGLGTTLITITSLASSGAYLVAGAGGPFAISVDAVTWSMPPSYFTGLITAMLWIDGVFVAGTANRKFATSTDETGSAWIMRDAQMDFINAFAYGDGLLVAVGNDVGNVPKLAFSADLGNSWKLNTQSWSVNFVSATFGASHFVAADSSSFEVSGPDVYASLADLQDDTLSPAPSAYKAYPAGGYFRLGSTPTGIITADPIQGATAADRTVAQIFPQLLARAGLDSSDYNAGDLTALDVLDDSEVGYWTMTETTVADVLDFIAGTPGAAWPVDQTGIFRLEQLAAPSGTPDLVITKDDIIADQLVRVTSNDVGNGIPIYQVKVRWGRFYQTITTDIAGAVSDADRAQFAQEWRVATATDLNVLAAHPSAQSITIDTAYSNAADAQAEADRQLALRNVKRDMYEVTLQLNAETLALDINSVLEVVHPRFSLSVIGSASGALEGGGLFRVLDVAPDAKNNQVTFTVWGRSRYQNVIDANGAYVIDNNGAYVLSERAA